MGHLTHLRLLFKKGVKTDFRTLGILISVMLLMAGLNGLLFYTVYDPSTPETMENRPRNAHHDRTELFSYEPRIGFRKKGVMDLQWKCEDKDKEGEVCVITRESMTEVCQNYGCFSSEVKFNHEIFILIRQFDGYVINMKFVNTYLTVKSPTFKYASEEFEKKREVPYPAEQFHQFYGTILHRFGKNNGYNGTVYYRYFSELSHDTTSDSIVFSLTTDVSRYVVYFVVLFLPIVPSMYMATAIADERKNKIKGYLMTIGVSRTTYLTHHILLTFLKTAFFMISTSFILFSGNAMFVGTFILAYFMYTLSVFAITVLITVALRNPKVVFEVILMLLPTLLLIPLSYTISRANVLHSIISCLNPGYALFHALDALRECSMKGGVLIWFSDFPYVLPFGVTLVLQIIGTFLNVLLAVSVDYFLSNSLNISKILSRYRRVNVDDDEGRSIDIHEHDEAHEGMAEIELIDLHKTWSTGERAVKGLNMNVFRDQITILLGQNGAGKSTTFDMITGLTLPTSGTIKIGGKSIEELRGGSHGIGLCPQYSAIFPKLTVAEHLNFFGLMNGNKDWDRDAKIYMKMLQLDGFKKAEALSGGQKRKLSVAMALIGAHRVILLDEPSSGVDTESRQAINKFLVSQKKSKTLLVTTHYTDEAETLGDRICIMANGRIMCSGNTEFLSQKFGAGYVLSCVVTDARFLDAFSERTLKLAQNFTAASMKNKHGLEFSINLEKNDNERLAAFFRELDHAKDRMGIVSFGVSATPLETVFLRVAEKTGSVVERRKVDRSLKLFLRENNRRTTEGTMQALSFAASIYKRIIMDYRSKFTLLSSFVAYFLMLLVSKVTTSILEPSPEYDLLKLTECSRIGIVNAPDLVAPIQAMANQRGECLVVQSVQDAEQWYQSDPFSRPPIIGAIERVGVNDYTMIMTHNRQKYEPYLATLLFSVLTNTPVFLNSLSFQLVPAAKMPSELVKISNLGMIFLVQIFFIGRFGRNYVLENSSGYAHLTELSGNKKWIYWASHFVVDTILFSIMYGVLYCFTLYINYSPEIFPDLFLQCYLCFFITDVKVAILHRFFQSKNMANNLIPMLLFMTPTLLLMIQLKLSMHYTNFSIEHSFPIMLDPYVAVLTYEKSAPTSAPNIFILLAIQLLFTVVIFVALEHRSVQQNLWRSFCNYKPPPVKEPVDQEAGDVELQPLSARSKNETAEVGIEAKPTNPRNVVLDVQNVVKYYNKKPVVKGITMMSEQNECFGLLGHNGAGKSTTFKILTGQVYADSGEAIISGDCCTTPAHIGYCPQDDALITCLTGKEHLTILAALHGYEDPFKIAKILIDCVGMKKQSTKIFKHLSGGQKRKLSVCASILGMSKLIILDEPTTGIDPMVRNDIWNLLKSIRDTTNTAIVLTSHSMAEVDALCSRVAVMTHGLITTHGTPQTIKSQHGEFFKLVFLIPSADPIEGVPIISYSVAEIIPTAKFISQNLSRYTFKVPRSPGDSYSEVFAAALALSKILEAKDFSVVQSTLEDAFLSLGDSNKA